MNTDITGESSLVKHYNQGAKLKSQGFSMNFIAYTKFQSD